MHLNRSSSLNDVQTLGITQRSVIHENQEAIAQDVVDALSNRKVTNIMVISKTQSGKTGSMMAVINLYLEGIIVLALYFMICFF